MRPLVGICFDLDGVLIDTMPFHARAWQDALEPLGIRVATRLIYQWEGEAGRVTARTLLHRLRQRPAPGIIGTLLARKERRFKQLARHIHPHPQLVQLIKRLSHRSIRLALVTGTSWHEVQHIVPRSLLREFHTIITGDHVRQSKPHPEPYQRAFRALRVPPAQVIVVENAPYGIRAAKQARAGLVVALTSSLPKRYLREADRIVHSLPQLCRMLEQLTSSSGCGYNTLMRVKIKEAS